MIPFMDPAVGADVEDDVIIKVPFVESNPLVILLPLSVPFPATSFEL